MAFAKTRLKQLFKMEMESATSPWLSSDIFQVAGFLQNVERTREGSAMGMKEGSDKPGARQPPLVDLDGHWKASNHVLLEKDSTV